MRKHSRTVNSILNIISGFGGQLLLIIFKFIVRTVFIHTLGKEFLGINGLFVDIMTMLSLTELGFDTAINYKLYKPLAENDEKRVRVLLKFYRRAYLVVGLSVLGLGLLAIPFLPYIIKDYDSLETLNINAVVIFLLYLAQTASSYLFFAYRSAIIKAAQREYLLNLSNYIITIVSSIAQIVILYATKDFILYTSSLIGFNILQNLVYAVIATRAYPQYFIKEKDSISKEERNSILKDCGALFVFQVNFVVIKATDNIVLSAFLGLAIVGLYSNYLLFYTTIRAMLDRFYNAIKASMGNLFVESSVEKKHRFFQVINYLTAVLYGTAGVGVAVVADELIETWISSEYVIKQPLAILVGIELLFVGMKKNLGQVRNISGAFKQMWYRPIIGMVINLVVSVAMVNVIGIYGVLIGTISADICANFLFDPAVIYRYSLENYRPVSEYYIRNLGYIAILVCDFGVCWLTRIYLLTGFGWFSVIFHAVVCAVIVPLSFVLIYRKSTELDYLKNTARGILGRKLGKTK